MNHNSDKTVAEQAIADVLEREDRNRHALSFLLEQQREKDGHLLALRLNMGQMPSYLATVSLGWVAQHVHFAGDLPIFREKGKVHETSKAVVIDAGTIDDIQQRRPDWRRQLPMAVYLASRLNRKFPPLLVVGYKGWVYEDPGTSDAWGEDERAMRDSITATPLEPKGIYHDLDVKDTSYYALDGQHRLMAIMGLKELLDKGRLFALDQNGNPRKSHVITRDQVIESVCAKTREDEGVIHERLQRIMDDDYIGIEIIPAVVQNETYEHARLRLRSVFVDVNENAKKPTKGESIVLDENNGFRIVARRVMVAHRLLKNGKTQDKQGQLAEASPYYTTLDAIVQIANIYLKSREEFSEWVNPMLGDRQLGFIRPEETSLQKGTGVINDYFNALANLPSHIRFLQGKKAAEIRGQNDEDNIFFRPIAQIALATAVAELGNGREKPLADIFRQIAAQEEKDQLKLHNKKSPWFGVLCDSEGKMRRHKSYQDLCAKLLIYLLGGGITDDERRKELRDEFVNARSVGETKAIDSNGNEVLKDKVELPHLW